MPVVYSGHTEEHEDNGLRTARQHLHRVLDGCVRLVRYIGLDIVLHGDAAECYSAEKQLGGCPIVKSGWIVYRFVFG